ncbi:unnamed protein product [Effrenium voratum]|uniref:dCMP deaminase n=1 Tax=Effrenium voratum TaxID=2562239 RepID=A0AA36IIN5_9DINO|nr:unnamed protein product [Effrenium voratum]CAJ1451456.1 unnamed protein product [Effrenium voratum]
MDQGPRRGALSWDDYFMGLAFLTAMRSKDPSTQVGACIVNDRNRIIGVGYNGMPTNCPNEELPWSKTSSSGELATKYPYVVHAELNAVLNKNAESCAGCRLYSTLFPCNECAKVIIQAGIRQVIYASDKHAVRASAQASRRLFELAGVEMRHYEPEKESLQLPLRYQPREGTCVSCGGPGLRVGQVHGHGHGGHEGHSRASGLGQWAQWAQWAPWMLAAGFALGAGKRFRLR